MHNIRILLRTYVLLLCSFSVALAQYGVQNPVSHLPDALAAKEDRQSTFKEGAMLSVSEGSRGLSKIISMDQNSGGQNSEDGQNCWVYDSDGNARKGACYRSYKGPDKPFEHRVPLTSHNMVANALEDEHFGDNIIGRVLTTKVGNAIAAFNFGQPAAGQILETALNYAQNEAVLCQQTHIQYLSDLINGPGGDAEAKAYLGCVRKYSDINRGGEDPDPQLDGQQKGPPCQAIAACQNDDYLPNEERGKSANVLPADRFESNYSTAFVPIDNECHPLNPKLNWTDPYEGIAANSASRLLFSDLLFCEYHKAPCVSRTVESTRGNTSKSNVDIWCDTGISYEQFLKQYVGNFALLRKATTGLNRGIFSVEWQSVAPYTLSWPPTGGEQKPAPDVYALYKAGETFTYLMQMMRNRCLFHNLMETQNSSASAIQRSVVDDTTTFQIKNGQGDVPLFVKEARDHGFCASQQEILQAHRSALSLSGLLFDEATCDVMWIQAMSHMNHFNQATYSCDELAGCMDGSCTYDFPKIVANPQNYQQWVLLLAAYSKVLGDMKWRADLQKMDHHIKSMTRGKDTWYLNKAQELIQDKLTAKLDNTIEVSKDALNRELDRLVEEKGKNMSSVTSNTAGNTNESSGSSGGGLQ